MKDNLECDINWIFSLIADNRNVLNNGGCLSPTSNQLAKWFSPQLLEDASAGKLPQMNVNQMLSLEEFEKCIQNT